jgi:hypothetical protein
MIIVEPNSKDLKDYFVPVSQQKSSKNKVGPELQEYIKPLNNKPDFGKIPH